MSNLSFPSDTCHVIVLDFPWMRDKDPRTPLGHASLLATLAQNQNLVSRSFIRPINGENRFSIEQAWNEIAEMIEETNGGNVDIAIGAYVWAEEVIQVLLPKIRDALSSGRIILGGPQISYLSSGLESLYPECDIFVRGYGEMALLAICSSHEKQIIQGVHYAGDPDENKQTVIDLDLLPSPFLSGIVSLEGNPFIRWESQRGCPFSCSFCQHKEAGAKLRKKEFCEGRIFREIDMFCENKVSAIAVLDPIFNASAYAVEILRRFKANGFKGHLSLQCRAEMINEEFVNLVRDMNVTLEFGLQTIHRNEGLAVKRQNNMRKVAENLTLVSDAGIEFEISVIFGLPHQTYDSFLKTVSWCLHSRAASIKAFPLMLLRGTELEERKHEWGLTESAGSMPVVLGSNSYGYEDWCAMAKISQALKETEGEHPSQIHELIVLSETLDPEFPRFTPNKIEEGLLTSRVEVAAIPNN
jgi:radical SAM superfamily enzyme YgiQ (UPF0313 family)